MPAEPTRPPPTAGEVEALVAEVRRNPRSTAFVALADAYLTLGRPYDAIDVLGSGLKVYPDHAEGRLQLGRAHAMLHQWMEAQAELIRAVKLDKKSREGFRLLGEVLMRSADYERALQVLQHAYNLDPADPRVLSMLKRAREGRPLDAPPPVPRAGVPGGPAPPSGSGPVKRATPSFDIEPTRVADPEYVDAALGEQEDRLAAMGRGDPTEIDSRSTDQVPQRAVPPPLPRAPAPPPIPRPSAPLPRANLGGRPAGPPPAPTVAAKARAAPPPPPPEARDDDESGIAALGRMALEKQRSGPAPAEEKAARRVRDARGEADAPARKKGHVPPPEDPFKPLTLPRTMPLDPAQLARDSESPEPEEDDDDGEAQPRDRPRAEGGRPRLEHAPHKRADEGAEAMRRSAGAGEDYLNQLLGSGLLSVPNVEARDVPLDPTPPKRWGRSRIPYTLFIWLVTLAAVGALAWYVVLPYMKQRREYKVPPEIAARVTRGTADDFTIAQEEFAKAAKKRPSALAVASLVKVKALALLVYGEGREDDVLALIAQAALRVEKNPKPGAPGVMELAVARAAWALHAASRAPDPDAAHAAALGEVTQAMTAGVDDGTLRWMEGMGKLGRGDRAGARAAFEQADAGGTGPPIARIALGDLALDDGDAQGALVAYEAALSRADKHPWAILGRALVQIELKGDAEAAQGDLNVNLSKAAGARLDAWKHLATGLLLARLEDYEKAKSELDLAASSPVMESRFQARLALLRLERGEVGEADRLRALIRSEGGKGGAGLVSLLDAELLLARGLAPDALLAIGDRGDARGKMARGRALLDSGRPAEAEKEFAAVLDTRADDLAAKTWRQLSRVAARSGTKDAIGELQTLARAAVSTFPRHALGEAYVLSGQPADAKRELEAALEGNPFAYRARVKLAGLYLAEGLPTSPTSPTSIEDAEKALRLALEQAPNYVPAHGALARVLMAKGKSDEALGELRLVVDAQVATAEDELSYAEVLVRTGGDKEAAKDAVRRARDKGASPAELGRVAELIDPAFTRELGVPAPKPERPGGRGR